MWTLMPASSSVAAISLIQPASGACHRLLTLRFRRQIIGRQFGPPSVRICQLSSNVDASPVELILAV